MSRWLVFWLLLSWSAVAEPAREQKEIEKLYERLSVSAQLKFVDGLFCLQAPNFQAYTADHRSVDLSMQKERYESLLSPALTCRHKTDITAFKRVRGGVLCQVHQLLQWEQVDGATRKLISRTVDTRAEDFWVKRPVGWRIQASLILSQQVATEEAGPGSLVKPPRQP